MERREKYGANRNRESREQKSPRPRTRHNTNNNSRLNKQQTKGTMSKRLPRQRQPRHQAKPSETIPSSSTTELDPKMLNISAGGHFYERAKSRRNRHREVFASTKAGRAITDEAVPLGSKRKNRAVEGVNSVKIALARFKSEKGLGRKRHRSATEERTISSRGNGDEFESKSSNRRVDSGDDESKRKSALVAAANDDRISNDKNDTSFREIIDLTD